MAQGPNQRQRPYDTLPQSVVDSEHESVTNVLQNLPISNETTLTPILPLRTPRRNLSLDTFTPELLESIFVFHTSPRSIASICRLFHEVVCLSKSFKRRWLRYWLHPKLPDAFMPSYSDLCKAIETETPFYILTEIIDLQRLGGLQMASSKGGHVTKLVDVAYAHPQSQKLIPFLIDRGLKISRYIRDHALRDFELKEDGSEKQSRKDYLSPVIFAKQHSSLFCEQLATNNNFFTETDLAFAITIHQRWDAADILSSHPQHTLDVLAESVDRQFPNGIAWAFARGVGDAQKRNPLYLRICIEKADVRAARILIQNGALINISPSSHYKEPSIFGSTSLLEFSIQCSFAYYNEEANRAARIEMVKLFLEMGADPNSDNGRPLALCVTNHNWQLTQILLDSGADPRCDDMIALKIAMNMEYKDMAKVLHQKIKKLDGGERNHSRNSSHSSDQGILREPDRHIVMKADEASTSLQMDHENGNIKKLVRRMTQKFGKITVPVIRRHSEGDELNNTQRVLK